MITSKLRILIVEDEITDYQLIVHQILKIALNTTTVHIASYSDFIAELNKEIPDIVLCDYKLNGLTGMDILEYTMGIDPNIYFIFITGTINDEEVAANTILSGASGYILKKHMATLNEKLLPHFKKVIATQADLTLPEDELDVLLAMQKHIENSFKSKKLKTESYKKIQDIINKLKEEQ